MSFPTFPDILKTSTSDGVKTLNSGAWLVSYEPLNSSSSLKYDGTIRIENTTNGRTSSGDLYKRPKSSTSTPNQSSSNSPPSPANGIPIQSRATYRYYIRVTKITENNAKNTFELEFELFRFNRINNNEFAFTQEPIDSGYIATLEWTKAPASHPNPEEYAMGSVKLASTGKEVARMTMGRVSDRYRKISVEIDNVSGSEQPLNNGVTGSGRQDWETVFDRVGLECELIQSNRDIPESSPDGVWTDAALHSAMLRHRKRVNLDQDWRYYVLSAKRSNKSVFGIMFDAFGTDSNNIAREGIFVCSHVTAGGPAWPTANSMRFGEITPAFFRTSLHELGHAFGLLHNDDGLDGFSPVLDGSFMNKTSAMLQRSSPQDTLMSKIKWNYSDLNLYQLRHWPDVFIRPGGVNFASATNVNPPIAAQDEAVTIPGLTLAIDPLQGHEELPLGAPVRVDLKLTNNGTSNVLVPADIGLKSNELAGTITDGTGYARGFQSIFCYEGLDEQKDLAPGESLTSSLTLLRGAQGALFPVPGISTIDIKLSWRVKTTRGSASVKGSTTIKINPPANDSHAAAAQKLMDTPDAHLVLVLGGDYLKEGIAAIGGALEDETLCPYFASVEAKRIAKPFPGQKADLERAAELVRGPGVVMSDAEKVKLEKWGYEFKN
ncbi:uncharacterized protein RAG0_03155 [Rhynchosporium agropyri]|uniref:Uncharacterized protein n=1 Tax=Rhynchosporium agropyri TaxID=914238 RepID=A0A1E1K334_9HELO|nr:uncharacterized protein RAG0_03155 [Rhynchosporium agropyri]